MVPVTRFNPTSNDSLHLGHLYTALVNEAVAHSGGGRFIVRFDDSNPFHLENLGARKMAAIGKGQREDLEWLGIRVDNWVQQSDVLEGVHAYLAKRLKVLPDEAPVFLPELIGDDYAALYPLAPMLTAEKVVMDYMEGINLLIRGVDLMTEYALYQYFCRLLELPQPRHIYLPRLKWSRGDMSKTNGGKTISDLRYSGMRPGQVRDILAKACLWYAPNGWTLHNLRGVPRLQQEGKC